MDKFIDVERVIQKRNPKLLKWLPKFFIRWIEKIIHQEELNDATRRYAGYDTHQFSKAVVDEFNLKLSIKGLENVPRYPEGIIFAGNHPLGGLDAIAIIDLLKEVRQDIYFISNDFLMEFAPLRDRFVGVNKLGKNSADSMKKVEELFASDKATFIFPSGLVSRKIKGKIEDLEWKKTFVSKAKKYNKKVVPVYIEGKMSNRFYRMANIRKLLGIKLNIEMFFLVDELFKQKNANIEVVIGEPIMPDTFTKEKNDREWAAWVKDRVYKLKRA